MTGSRRRSTPTSVGGGSASGGNPDGCRFLSALDKKNQDVTVTNVNCPPRGMAAWTASGGNPDPCRILSPADKKEARRTLYPVIPPQYNCTSVTGGSWSAWGDGTVV
jgi:hypothetical protein